MKIPLSKEQKVYLVGLDKSKHRKQQKLQFKLQNAFFALHDIKVIDAEIVIIQK